MKFVFWINLLKFLKTCKNVLSILMSIKVHNNWNAFTVLKFLGHIRHSRVFVRRRASSVMRCASYIVRGSLTILYFYFLKITWPIATIFSVKHFFGKRNLNCEIHGSTSPRDSNAEPNMQKKSQISKIFFFLLPHMYGKMNTWLWCP